MNYYKFSGFILIIVVFSAVAESLQKKVVEVDLCQYAKEYHRYKKFKKGDEVLECMSSIKIDSGSVIQELNFALLNIQKISQNVIKF